MYAFCGNGVVTVSDSGTSILSRQIEDKLLKLQSPDYAAFKSSTVGVFYDSDRKYILTTVKDKTDTVATITYVYNFLTNAWVSWDMGKTCLLVNTYDDKLYAGATDINLLEKERKNFDYTDHCDRETPVILLSYSRNITSINAPSLPATTVIITAENHGLTSGNVVELVNTNCTPNIDGQELVTVLSNNTFSVSPIDHSTGLPLQITVAGTSGYWTTKENNIISATFDNVSDISVGDSFSQLCSETVNSTSYGYVAEAIITSINKATKTVTFSNSNLFQISGGFDLVYKHFSINVKWIPIHGGDPSVIKQFREAHVMFDKYRGYGFQLEFSNDTKRSEELTSLDKIIIPNFGRSLWGTGNFGGESGSKNLRVYLPQDKQRCRLLTANFSTAKAREKWRLEGIALFFRFISERTDID